MMTIMPLSLAGERAHDELVSKPSQRRPTTQLIVDHNGIKPLAARHLRMWVRLVAGLRCWSLDTRLAEGEPPESNRTLAARADVLVSPAMGGDLAQSLENVLSRARRPTSRRGPQVLVNRHAIVRCQPEMQAVIDALRVSAPTPVRGYAAVIQLLRDGTGPLFNPRRATELADALATAAAYLDCSTCTAPSA
jgi:hypothetical protein